MILWTDELPQRPAPAVAPSDFGAQIALLIHMAACLLTLAESFRLAGLLRESGR